ncbi:hypothetical protein ACFE04_025540 [Oxalis oulophora]
MEKKKKKVGIVGAGISGLVGCKHLAEMGFNPIVFEASTQIGGVWSKTINSTKLQTPKEFYQFSDFPWPSSVKETFPPHYQVMDYLHAYAQHFDLLRRISFNSKVITIEYVFQSGHVEDDLQTWNLWGGNGEAFSSIGKWKLTIQDTAHQSKPVHHEVYELDFVILCVGKYNDLPNIPEFPPNQGPQVFDGKVLHSMDYAALGNDGALQLVKEKRLTVVGFQKSAVDIAVEIANRNGPRHPCTLLFRAAHWMAPDHDIGRSFKFLNRFTELIVHKPSDGFFLSFLAVLFWPLLQIFSTSMELYLKWRFPLNKYQLVPAHSFLQQMYSCMLFAMPYEFYERVKEGSIILKKTPSFRFCKNGLIVDGSASSPWLTDVVIFATGYKGDEKLKNIFASNYFQRCIFESELPLYRDSIHPRIPQLAILGFADSPAVLHTTEMRSKWVAHFLVGKFKLPNIKEMDIEVKKWEKCTKAYSVDFYRRSCVSPLLQIFRNDQLLKDMGCNPRRKKWFLSDLFSPYLPSDYGLLSSTSTDNV